MAVYSRILTSHCFCCQNFLERHINGSVVAYGRRLNQVESSVSRKVETGVSDYAILRNTYRPIAFIFTVCAKQAVKKNKTSLVLVTCLQKQSLTFYCVLLFHSVF